jgi:hypothetical protein
MNARSAISPIVGELAELRKWMVRQIDGSPETAARDQKITALLKTVDRASSFIELDGIASTWWTPVAKGLPDDDTTVLIALDDGEVWTGYVDGGEWLYVSGDPMSAKVTHWQHLPARPPKEPT